MQAEGPAEFAFRNREGECPLLPLSGHPGGWRQSPLPGVKRTFARDWQTATHTFELYATRKDGLSVLVSDYCCAVHCPGWQMRRCEFIALLGMDVQLPIMELGKALMA